MNSLGASLDQLDGRPSARPIRQDLVAIRLEYHTKRTVGRVTRHIDEVVSFGSRIRALLNLDLASVQSFHFVLGGSDVSTAQRRSIASEHIRALNDAVDPQEVEAFSRSGGVN